jgi:hypothetical protein
MFLTWAGLHLSLPVDYTSHIAGITGISQYAWFIDEYGGLTNSPSPMLVSNHSLVNSIS